MTDDQPPAPRTTGDASTDDWTAEDIAAESMTTDTSRRSPRPAASDRMTWIPAVPGQSDDARICPFLRSVGADGSIAMPLGSADPANRCAALGDLAPQSLRQQELVCLTGAHVDCPRYAPGVATVGWPTPVATPRRTRPRITPAIAASLVILALSFGASLVFGLANGGLVLPSGGRTSPGASSSQVAQGSSGSATPSAGGSGSATASASAPAGSASPPASASPSTGPSVNPSPSPSGAPTVTPTPSSDRFLLLTACTGKPDCWIYVIRSGDNLSSIANYFGVSLARVRQLNPWTATQGLRAGRQLIIPTPTR